MSDRPNNNKKRKLATGNSEQKYSAMEKEIQDLKDGIRKREAQIIVLRPYRTQFTREDAQKDFKTLLAGIRHWVEDWTDNLTDEANFPKEWMTALGNFPHVVNPLRELLEFNVDLKSAIGYPGSDQEILVACIVRFIMQSIFEGTPCGIKPHTAEILQSIEETMPACSNPGLEINNIWTWRAQAYHAMFSHPLYPEHRQRDIDVLSAELAQVLEFLPNLPNDGSILQSISSRIIEPAVSLNENFRRSNDNHYFETTSGFTPGARIENHAGRQTREFFEAFFCRNALKRCAKFRLEKLKTTPNVEEIHFICSLIPALKARGLQGKYGVEVETVCNETIMIAWDTTNLRGRDPSTHKCQTWLSRTCSTKPAS
ncbi:hypothetical protein F4808DRAFT_474013 [Astrocystis sublimbata]|nr:hypothetical protein F4808DRAFT_474013 [Astrocystis sublimbata]